MRKIFIDCGAHCGCSIRNFEKNFKSKFDKTIHEKYPDISPKWEIYSFEPNPSLWDFVEKHDTNLIKKAIWINDDLSKFWIIGKKTGGSTLFKKKGERHKKLKRHKVTTTEVECIDFSAWIVDNFEKSDFIFLKVDVEGAEYSIFDKMIEDDSMSYVNLLAGEFHNDKCGVNKSEDKRTKEALIDKYGLKFTEWDSMRQCHRGTDS